MKNNKKLNSIVTMSKEELQEVNGGLDLIYYPKRWINGMPAPECSVSLTAVSNLGMIEMIPEMMEHRMIH